MRSSLKRPRYRPRKSRRIKLRRLRRPPKAKEKYSPKKKPKERYRGPPVALRPFQREGVDWLKRHNWTAMLADAPGCGKTPQSLMAIRENYHILCPALVICPSSVAWNWSREAIRWLPGGNVHIIEGKNDPIPDDFFHMMIIPWDLLHYRVEEIKLRRFQLIVADEAHYAKNPDSRRSKSIRELKSNISRIILLTGTPLINTPSELATLKDLIGGEEAPILRRLLEDIAPEIPPKRRVIVPVDVPEDMIEEYQDVEQRFETWIDEYLYKRIGTGPEAEEAAQRAINTEALAKIGYLRRIVGRAKVPAAAAWTLQMLRRGESVVIYAEHSDVLDTLVRAFRKLRIKYVRIDGTTARQQRGKAIDGFQKGRVRVFLGTRAAIEGITLTRARNLLFLERWFTPSQEEQAEDRIRRIGQRRETVMWYLMAKNTIDERLTEIINNKRKIIADHIGSATIQEKELSETLAVWRKIKPLTDLVDRLAQNPTGRLRLPNSLPPVSAICAVIFDMEKWPVIDVGHALRAAGIETRKLEKQGSSARIRCRIGYNFAPGSLKRYYIADGFAVIAGRPSHTPKRK